MKKLVPLIIIAMLVITPVTVHAVWTDYNVDAWIEYDESADVAYINFANAPANASRLEIEVKKLVIHGQLQGFYDYPPYQAGRLQITINGQFALRWYDANGNKIAYAGDSIPITKIENNRLDNGQAIVLIPQQDDDDDPGDNDTTPPAQPTGVNVTISGNNAIVTWDENTEPDLAGYKVYCNGVLMNQDLITGTSFVISDLSYDDLLPGQTGWTVEIIAVDEAGNESIQSEPVHFTLDGVDDPGNGNGDDPGNGNGDDPDDGSGCDDCEPEPDGCDVCDKLIDLLECPGWDDYMSDLTDAIRDALPPPPNWDRVAETFVDHFADYFGSVPSPPSESDLAHIKPPLPQVDTSIPEAENLVPMVPDDYNETWDFDITDGEVIPVVDESEPFEIYDPDEFIDADPPGTFVYPGDERNDSRGIKSPDTVDTGNAAPQPTESGDDPPPPSPAPSIPPDEPPNTPIPGQPDDPTEIPPTMPKPTPEILPIPKPKGG